MRQKRHSKLLTAGSDYRPFIIPIFLPEAGCRHRCIYCDQESISGSLYIKDIDPQKVAEDFLKYKGKDRKTVQIAFYGGNFLGLEKIFIERLLKSADKLAQEKKIDSIRFSTRPDTISDLNLDSIADYPVSTIEIGAQSMDDEVLRAAGRGHSAEDTVNAVKLLKKRGYETGVQMMVGLPLDDELKSIETGKKIAELKPDFVRIYPLVVLKNTALNRLYKTRKFVPLQLDEAVSTVKKLYLFFTANNIKVIRMGIQYTGGHSKKSGIVAGPYHPAFGHLVYSAIFFDRASDALKKNKIKNPVIKVNPGTISKLRGIKNINIERLKKEFDLESIKLLTDSEMGPEEISVV